MREDDARVAACAHKRAARALLGNEAGGGLFEVGDVFGSGPHRQAHVGAGVAVGNWEDIEGVNSFAMLFQPGVPSQNGSFQDPGR